MSTRGAWTAMSIITGLLMIILGAIFLAQPGLSLATVILLFGLFVIAYGVVEVVKGISGKTQSRAWTIVVGVLAAIAGIALLAWPGLTGLALVYLIAAWAVISGVTELAGAFAGGLSGGARAWLAVVGIVSLLAGIVLFVHPLSGALAVLWVIGIYLVALGIARIIMGFAPPPAMEA